MIKRILTVLIVLLLPLNAFATAQISDHILYKGETYSLFSEPLESYFTEPPSRPNDLFAYKCTACWRGYVASWEIKEKYLYLVNIVDGTCGTGAKEIAISRIFPGQKAPVKAIWFSGALRIPQGKQLRYEHMGYGTVYEKELMLTIKSGEVVGEQMIDNTLMDRIPVPIPPPNVK